MGADHTSVREALSTQNHVLTATGQFPNFHKDKASYKRLHTGKQGPVFSRKVLYGLVKQAFRICTSTHSSPSSDTVSPLKKMLNTADISHLF